MRAAEVGRRAGPRDVHAGGEAAAEFRSPRTLRGTSRARACAARRRRQAMKTLDEFLADAAQAHGHLCAGQVLGVRMAMLGLEKLGIDDPRGKDRKRLVTFVEIDRCATDAVAVVTGCRLGKRASKFRDWGRVAATSVRLSRRKAIRVAAKESSKTLARQIHPEIENKNQQQMLAYREMSDDDLFAIQWVKVKLPPEEFPGYKGDRAVCELCGEGIKFRLELLCQGRVL